MIKLFEIENSEVKPTEHCYTISALKSIMEEYPVSYLSIYAYLFYKSCLNEDLNPFANAVEAEKDDLILEEVGGDFDPDDELIEKALELTMKLYETPTSRTYKAFKMSIEALDRYLATTPITDGRDGNGMLVLKAQKEYGAIRKSFNEVQKDFKDEQNTSSRGGGQISYDQL